MQLAGMFRGRGLIMSYHEEEPHPLHHAKSTSGEARWCTDASDITRPSCNLCYRRRETCPKFYTPVNLPFRRLNVRYALHILCDQEDIMHKPQAQEFLSPSVMYKMDLQTNNKLYLFGATLRHKFITR